MPLFTWHIPQEGHLAQAVSLQVPTNLPLVVVFSAVYGSPGEPKRGRGKARQEHLPDLEITSHQFSAYLMTSHKYKNNPFVTLHVG